MSARLIHTDGRFASCHSLKHESFLVVARDESKQPVDRPRRRRFTQRVTHVPRQMIEFLRCLQRKVWELMPILPALGRVEDGRGGLGHPASPRFASPLIERSMRISRTTLSDWLHRKAHDEAHVRSRLSGGRRLRLAAELLPMTPGTSGVCRLSPITMPSPSSEAHQKSGSFPPPALPGLSSHMTLSDSR